MGIKKCHLKFKAFDHHPPTVWEKVFLDGFPKAYRKGLIICDTEQHHQRASTLYIAAMVSGMASVSFGSHQLAHGLGTFLASSKDFLAPWSHWK